MLEIARQSVPDGYGNSYFWVKPDRIVPADLVRTVGGRLDHRGGRSGPSTRRPREQAVEYFAARGITALAVCFLHSYANAEHEREMARGDRAEYHPQAVFSLSSQVLPEYREYERAMTTLIDAAVKPTVASYVSGIARRLAALDGGRRIPFSIMRSNGGVLSAAGRWSHQPISTVLSGPAAGALGAAVIADRGRLPVGGDLRRRWHFDRCHGDHRRATVADHRGFGRTVPGQDPDDRHRDGRRRRRIGGLDVGGGHAQGRPRSAGADPGPACYRLGRHRTHRHRRASGARPDPAAPARRRDPAGRRGGDRGHRRGGRSARADDRGLRRRDPGDLGVEPGQRAAPDHHQTWAGCARLPAWSPSAGPVRCWPAG